MRAECPRERSLASPYIDVEMGEKSHKGGGCTVHGSFKFVAMPCWNVRAE
jgi:hypothetical protein